MHSIRVKIAAISVAAILTIIISIIGASYSTLKAKNTRDSVEIMNLLSSNVQKALDDYLDSIEQSVEMIANLASDSLDDAVLVKDGVAGKAAEGKERTDEQIRHLDAYLADYCANIQEVCASVASYTHGVVAYYFCISPEVSETEHGFFYSRAGISGFDEREPLDARTLDPADISHTTWYFTPIQRGRPSWVGPYSAHFLDESITCSYLVPIYKAGVLVGVLGMDIPFDTLITQVKGIRVYQTGFAALFSDDGTVMYHPDYPYGATSEILEEDLQKMIFRQADNGNELIRYTANGQERQLSFSTLSNGMKLIVTAPVKEVTAAVMAFARRVILLSALIIVGFTAILLVVLRLITNPLKKLTAASTRLAAEDYSVQLDYHGKDEVGTLTKAFMQMRDHVQAYINDLNRRIYTDPMTGVPNMRHFFNLALRERDRLYAEGKEPVMLYFNLVGLKFYNRQYSFAEGDKLIREVAEILLRHFDISCMSRFGADHFAVVTQKEGLEQTLQTIFAECAKANGGKSLPVRVGIYPDSLESVDVNSACDRAKFAVDRQAGAYVSGFQYFDSDMLRHAFRNNYVINHLDQALESGWIQVYYHPIVRAASGKICDEEALARWIDPEFGVLAPDDFIPALEMTKLIYKLDLYVVDRILEKTKRLQALGMQVVPVSVNLSRVDFEMCDVVEEIRRRVDDAGVSRGMLTIEITESVIGSDFEGMKAQIARFQALGFRVWMDDFGSGYSSLDVLQSLRFDLIKLDMRFMRHYENDDRSKIILTELIRMAISLGIDTITEGVEREDQMEFLREIGCTKLQGFYYSRPVPLDEIISRYQAGIGRGYEDQRESAYYAAIGRVNLYDLATVTHANEETYEHYLDTLPMAILSSDRESASMLRSNQAFREFMEKSLGVKRLDAFVRFDEHETGPGAEGLAAVRQCGKDRPLIFVNEELPDGSTVHLLVRHIAVNPVTGFSATALAVLGLSDESDRGVTYTHIAQALSADYINLYYVNLDTEQFSEYNPDPAHAGLTIERRGFNFFEQSRTDARIYIFEPDREAFISAFTKENVTASIDRDGAFALTYRLLVKGEPKYVNLKAVRMNPGDSHVIMGVNNVDAQMKERETIERLNEEQITYARISALSGSFIAIYTVDPVTDQYEEYSATKDYEGLGLAKQGDDFFRSAKEDSLRLIYAEDLSLFQASFSKENVLGEIRKNGLYELQYRLMIAGEPRYVSLKAAQVEEKDGPRVIIGVNNIDAQVRREQELTQNLSSARSKANIDVLTGVKNSVAFESMENQVNAQILVKQPVECLIAVFDVLDVDETREEKGQDEVERLLKAACATICAVFTHSPVYRIADSVFIAVARGADYTQAAERVARIAQANRESAASGGPIIACGTARFEGDRNVAAIVERAEAAMQEDRKKLRRGQGREQ